MPNAAGSRSRRPRSPRIIARTSCSTTTPVTSILTWDPETRKVKGGQFCSKADISGAANVISMAIQAGFTIDQLANVDFLFQPNFDKPVYYVGAVAMKAAAGVRRLYPPQRNPGVMGAGERKERRRRKRLSYAACSAVITYNNTSFNYNVGTGWELSGNHGPYRLFLVLSRFTGSP